MLSSQVQVGNLVYSSVVGGLILNADGFAEDTTLVFRADYATYPGWANAAAQRQGGGVVVGGSSKDSLNTDRPVLYLFNEMGQLDTMYSYGIAGEDWIGRCGKQTPDGGYVITGETNTNGTSVDGFLLKVDSLGNLEWVQTYGLPNRTEYLTTVDLAPGNGYYLGGKLHVGGGNYDQWLLGVDSTGNEEWQETYGTIHNDYPSAHVTSLADGNVVFATSFTLNANEDQVLALVKVDPDGTTLWTKTYDGAQFNNALFAVKEVSPGGDLIAVGQSSLPGPMNGVLLRTTAQGDSLWLRYYHYADSVWTLGKGTLRDVMPTPDGGFIAVGTAYPSSNNPNDPPIYGQDTWVVKVDSLGCLEPGCHLITGLESQVTTWRGALTVAPNPASGVARLAWELPEGLVGSCQLSMVSAAGHLVETVPVALAEKNYSLDVSGYPAGLYHVHLVVDGRWVSGGRMVVSPP
ncbi:MAG: hypothetical protein IPM49_07325 [Flavobacteriales bacterium]|nr:hypothetical protein [Flavobacteriales bacterium]